MEANFSALRVGVSIEPAYLYGKIYLNTSFIIRDMTVGNRNNKSITITGEHGNSARLQLGPALNTVLLNCRDRKSVV